MAISDLFFFILSEILGADLNSWQHAPALIHHAKHVKRSIQSHISAIQPKYCKT